MSVLLSAGSYRKATFGVTSAEYVASDDFQPWSIRGDVEGHLNEEFDGHGFKRHTPSSEDDLRSMVKEGDVIPVYFNPSESRDAIQGEVLRIVYAPDGLVQMQKAELAHLLLTAVLPFIAAGSALLAASRRGRGMRRCDAE